MIPDFQLQIPGKFSDLLKKQGIQHFREACDYIQQLPYGRISDRFDLSLILEEQKGTCSSKHGFLAQVAIEQEHPEVEIIAGIFMMSGETHPELVDFFSGKPYSSIPECHCYLRYKGDRYDYTAVHHSIDRIIPKLVREQRIDPHQVIEWKEKIHQDYLQKWINRKPEFGMDFEAIWKDREVCIGLLEG